MVDDSSEQSEAKEIEITPAMIEAGEDALREFDLISVAEGWDSKGDVAACVYRAMVKAR